MAEHHETLQTLDLELYTILHVINIVLFFFTLPLRKCIDVIKKIQKDLQLISTFYVFFSPKNVVIKYDM